MLLTKSHPFMREAPMASDTQDKEVVMTSSMAKAGRWLATAALLAAAGCAGYKGTVATGDTDYTVTHPLIVVLPSTSRSLEEAFRQSTLDDNWTQQGRLHKGSGGGLPGGVPMALGGPTALCE
jgi:hypothetical protein